MEKYITVEANGILIKSEVEGSKNAITFFDAGNRVIIWTKKGEPIRILSKDLDDLIKRYTWSYNDNGYACTKIAKSKLPTLCASYGLDMEAFKDMDAKTPQVTIYIHRYVMGMYHTSTRKIIKEQYQGVIEEYGLSSINDLHVDHDICKSKDGKLKTDNYSDSMRLVPPIVNTSYKVKNTEAYIQDKFPITRNSDGYLEMTLSNDISTFKIKDTDIAGRNITSLQKELLKSYPSEYIVPLGIYKRNIANLNNTNIKQFKSKKIGLFNNLVDSKIKRVEQLEKEGQLIVKKC